MRAIRFLTITLNIGLFIAPAVAGAQVLPHTTSDAWLANPAIPYPVAMGVPNRATVQHRAEIVVAPWTPRTSFAPSTAHVLRGESPVVNALDPEITASVTFPATSASFGYAPGYAGLDVVDVDGDSRSEVIAIAQASSSYWYVADWTPQGLTMRYVSRGYHDGIVDAEVITVGGQKRYVVAAASTLYIYSLPDMQLLTSVPMPQELRRARVVDTDGDGTLELVTLTGGGYYPYPPYPAALTVSDLSTRTVRWQTELNSNFTYDFAIGDFRDEPGLEIVLAADASTVRSASNGTVLWTLPATPFVDVAAGNFDSDPQLEFAMMQSWDAIHVFDAGQQTALWSLTGLFDLDSVAAWDFDMDGRHELLVGDGQWGDVCVYSTSTQLPQHCIHNREHGVGRIAAGNIDGAPGHEIIWGAGVSSSGEDQLAVGRFGNPEVSWWASDESASHPDGIVADVDADGTPEYVYASYSTRSGYDSGRVHIANADTMKDEAVTAPLANSRDWLGTGGIDVAQLDSDPALEIIVATANIRAPELEIIDGATSTRQRTVVVPQDGPYGTPVLLPRVIDSSGVVFRYGSNLRRVALSDGAAVWTMRMPVGDRLNTLAVANVDDDSDLEIVAVTEQSTTVLNATTGVTEWGLPVGGAATIDHTRKQLVLAAGTQILVYDLRTHSLVRSVQTGGTAVAAWSADVANQHIVFAAYDTGALLAFDFASSSFVMSAAMDRRDLFRNASAVPTRVQGRRVSFWGQSDYAAHRMDVELTIRPLFEDGFE